MVPPNTVTRYSAVRYSKYCDPCTRALFPRSGDLFSSNVDWTEASDLGSFQVLDIRCTVIGNVPTVACQSRLLYCTTLI